VAPLAAAFDVLKPGGHLVIAESSRMLVPFKKPLHYYLPKSVKTDLHPWHFSANTLRSLFALSGFEIAYINRYLDQDNLIVIGRKEQSQRKMLDAATGWSDSYEKIIEFFGAWDEITQNFWPAS
jgi:hypothetical protein